MARGSRKPKEVKTVAQKLEDVIQEIEQTEAHLKQLKVKKKELEASLQQEKVESLLSSITEKSMTIEDAITVIKNLPDKTNE